MSEENEFNMYKNIVNNYFRISTFEKAKELCVRDMVQLNQRYITEAVCRNEALNRADKLQKENEHLRDIKNKAIEYIEENSFEDTTGVTLNLSDENYWKLLKLLKGDNVE